MLSLKRANWALLIASAAFLITAELLARYTGLNPYWAEVPYFALLPIFLVRREGRSPAEALRLGNFRLEQTFLAVGVYVLSLFVTIGVAFIGIVLLRRLGFSGWETGGNPLVDPRWSLNQSLFFFAIIPAVCEELFFRGYLLRAFASVGVWRAIIFSSLLFALLHGSLVRLPVTFSIGVVLSLLALKTGSLIPSMLVHFLNNAVAVTISEGLSRFMPTDVGPTSPLPEVSPLALLIFAGLAAAAGLAIWAITRPEQPFERPTEPLWPALRRTLFSLPVVMVEAFYVFLNFAGMR